MRIARMVALFLFACSFGLEAQQVEINGARHAFKDIVTQTTLKNGEIQNPLEGKTVTLYFIHGWSWTRRDSWMAERFWPLTRTQFEIAIAENSFDPIYSLTELLVADTKTKNGIVSFEMHIMDHLRHRGIAMGVFQTILQAAERQRQSRVGFASGTYMVIEMTGKFYLINKYVARGRPLRNSKAHFVFTPEFARILDYAEAVKKLQ